MELTKGTLIENAYVVRNLENAIDFWTSAGKAGPFFTGEYDLPADACQYKGKPSGFHTRFAFGVNGSIAVELVEQVGDAPSIFTEVLEQRGEGPHHLKFVTPSRSDEVDRLAHLGFEEVVRLSLGAPDRLISFVDMREKCGVFYEIMNFDHWRPAYEALVSAHQAWDGKKDPLRAWDRLSEYMKA